jgi:hypothetical protein
VQADAETEEKLTHTHTRTRTRTNAAAAHAQERQHTLLLSLLALLVQKYNVWALCWQLGEVAKIVCRVDSVSSVKCRVSSAQPNNTTPSFTTQISHVWTFSDLTCLDVRPEKCEVGVPGEKADTLTHLVRHTQRDTDKARRLRELPHLASHTERATACGRCGEGTLRASHTESATLRQPH